MKTLATYHNHIAALIALVVLWGGYLLAPDAKLDRLGHVLTAIGQTTGGQMIYAALATLAVAIVRWALARIPGGAKGPGAGGGAALLLALALGATCTGCGASALTMQGRAATIASVANASIGEEIERARSTELDACADEACADAGEKRWAPAIAAYYSVRTALATWIDALDVARQAGAEDGDVLGALLVAVAHLARSWNALAAALRALALPDLQPPDLPPIVAALLGAAS